MKLTVQYAAPLPPGFVSGTLTLKSRTVYIDKDGNQNQPYYRAAINPDRGLSNFQVPGQQLQIIGMGQGDPIGASRLDVTVTMVILGLPTPFEFTFQVLPRDTGGGNLNLHQPDINVPVIGPLPATLQALTDQTASIIQQAQAQADAAGEAQDLVLAAVDVAGVTLSLVPQAITEVKAQGNSAAALAAAAAGLTGVNTKADIPNAEGRYRVLSGADIGQVYQRVGGTLIRLEGLEAVSQDVVTARIVAGTLSDLALTPGKANGDARHYLGRTYWWDATNTETADSKTIIAAAGTPTGRWIVADREWGWHIKWFKQTSDTDDTAAFVAAAKTGNMIMEGGKTYAIAASTVISTNKSVHIASTGGQKAVIQPLGTGPAFTVAGVAAGASTTLAANTVPAQTTITVASAAGWAVGMLLKMTSTVLWPHDNRGTAVKGELHKISAISGNVVTLAEAIYDSYNVATETVTIQAYSPARFSARDLRIEYAAPTDVVGVTLNYTVDANIDHVDVVNAQQGGAGLVGCHNTLIDTLRVTGSNNVGLGYGVQDNGGYGTRVLSSGFVNCRRGVDFSGGYPARHGLVSTCTASVSGLASDGTDLWTVASGFGTHGPAEDITFQGNTVDNVNIGIESRGSNINITANTFRGNIATVVALLTGRDVKIKGNNYSKGTVGRNGVAGFSSLVNQSASQFVYIALNDSTGIMDSVYIEDNTADALKSCFLFTFVALPFGRVTNNTAKIDSNSGSNATGFIKMGQARTLTNFTCERNNIQVGLGVYTYIDPLATINWNTCNIDNYAITQAPIVWTGVGALANATSDLVMSASGRKVTVTGTLTFDVTTAAQIKVQTLVPPKVNFQKWRYGRGDTLATINEGLLTLTSGSGDLYVSSDTAGYSTAFPVGTGYVVPIDLNYLRA